MSTRQKVKKLIKRWRRFVSRNYREQVAQRQELAIIVRKLKKRLKALERKTAKLPEDERQAYRAEAELIRAQREKAHRLLRALKKGEKPDELEATND